MDLSPLLTAPIRAWLEDDLGASLDLRGRDPVPVVGHEGRAPGSGASPLHLVNFQDGAIASVRPDSVEAIRSVLGGLLHEELQSVFGAYELSRVTLPLGYAVFGPSWSYLGDAEVFRPVDDPRPVRLTPEEMTLVADPAIFWHCFAHGALMGFGIFEEDRLVSLATASPAGPHLFDIGVDSVPDAGRSGLGRAVVSAAGLWTLEQGRTIYYTTSPWNPPSARLARSLGLVHVFSETHGHRPPFWQPPQALGAPLASAPMANYYPAWAMNRDIGPRPE